MKRCRGRQRERETDRQKAITLFKVQFRGRAETSQGNKHSSCSSMSKENTLILLSTVFNPYTKATDTHIYNRISYTEVLSFVGAERLKS